MAYTAVFERYEFKYMITMEQKTRMLEAMQAYMRQDAYGRKTIRNLYFDTDNFRLIRRSLEKPVYKEKLRVRCYDKANGESAVFVELKKKYKKVVYKRRISMSEEDAMRWLCEGKLELEPTQITREIDYFMEFYGRPMPAVFLSYEREAYYALDGSDLRITFDENVLFRRDVLSLCADVWGTPLLEEGKVLLEVKTSGGFPLWLAHFLSEEKIYKTSFSKYGTAYQNYILPDLKENTSYVGTF
ncbi:MAG: polyphosphate polymerase domain-containing protein [Clostridia bacterium]|nr:polyphosphate polymerase domain-containing protein [Clostridia bacterium]